MAPRSAPMMMLLTRLANPEHVAADTNKVRKYVKEDLFERVVFVWNQKALEYGRVLHADFLKNCRLKIADGMLVDATTWEADTYMNGLWSVLVKDKCYTHWLSARAGTRHSRKSL